MNRIGRSRLSPVVLVGKLLGVGLFALGAGFAAVVGTAVMSTRPAVFLAVGLVVTAGLGGAGFLVGAAQVAAAEPGAGEEPAATYARQVAAVERFVTDTNPDWLLRLPLVCCVWFSASSVR